MAVQAGGVEVEVTLTGHAARIFAVERATEIEVAHAAAGTGYSRSVVVVAEEIEKYLLAPTGYTVELGDQKFTQAQWEAVQRYISGTDAKTQEVN